MRISYRWLSRHVDLSDLSPEEVAADLTMSTAEVEGLEPFAPHLAEVVVGHVQSRVKHPDADKLSVCEVDLGEGQPLSIVCGAPNVDAGQRVAVARPGTVLPGGLKLKRAKIRGVVSNGMICSLRELELGDEHDGIWVLPPDAPVGQPVADALDARDWVIEIDNKSLTHRPDLWGHRGIASEIAAIRRRPLRPLETELGAAGDGSPFPVRIDSPDCSRYLAVAIDGVVNGPSPDWMRLLLLAAGQRPIDLLVDLSNFVMLDLGQPNHLFDRRRLSPEGIRVRAARAGERITTLDGESRPLEPGDLLICSGDQPVALAGIMGGESSMVAPDTTQLLLEVATFDAVRVRRTSARLGLRTDSSARFEKSLDPTLPMAAAGHLVRTLRAIQPSARIAAPVTDAGDWSDPATTIDLRAERVRGLLGIDITDDQIADVLERLGFGVRRSGGLLHVAVPSARATKDISIEEDLVEEVGRLWRYDNIPEATLTGRLTPNVEDPGRELVRLCQDNLSGAARFHEVISYSFHSDDLLRRLGLEQAPHVRVVNPAAEGLAAVRRAVAPSLIGTLPQNLRHASEVRLFEIGKGYLPERANDNGEPYEVHEVALLWAAPPPGPGARFDAGRLLALRGLVQDLLPRLYVDPPRFERPAPDALPPWLDPKRSMRVAGTDASGQDVLLGHLGELEPGVARAFEIDADVAVGWLSLNAILRLPLKQSPYRPIPRFPSVKVDVALALPVSVPAAAALEAIQQAGKGLVADAELFDLYAGPNLGPGRKSLAWHVVLQSPDRTLSDKDTHKFLGRLERRAAELGGELRRE